MEEEIQKNLINLTKDIAIGDLPQVLDYLIEHDVNSKNEKEIIEAEPTTSGKNSQFLSVVETQDFDGVKNFFLEIPGKTNNEHSVDKILGIPTTIQSKNGLHPNIKSKWWPDEKLLIKSLHKRKFGSKLLVEELHERLLNDENRMVVLCESADAAKFSGMGGVGKTLTAKWYAHHYKEQYDHILWIDCGENSLKKSFEKLARDLDVKNRNELTTLNEFAQKTFLVLSEFKCLWIYDNAESYQGEDAIFKILPKAKENFFCVITSRSREWGIENVGHGKISDLQLEIYSDEESLDFLKSNLDEQINRNEHQLRELCRLMGNLPLALQLAASALNTSKIDLTKYIEKTSAEDSAVILEAKFDDYENNINKNIKRSLDLIVDDKKYGQLALDILMVFGYIRPDNVQSKLFMRIFKSKVEDIKEAVDILVKYSLVSRTGKKMEFPFDEGFFNKMFGRDKKKVEMDMLSIHRLLQQIIRHNGKSKERKTLKKILGCEGFKDYKLIPFTKYADKKLQKEFPKVRSQLLDHQQLQKLMREKRQDECVQLAKFIHQELNTKTSKLNYCVCLENYGQLEECCKTLEEELIVGAERKIEMADLPKLFKRWLFKIYVNIEWKLFDLYGEIPTETDVADFLFDIYMRQQKYEQAVEIINQTGSTEQINRILSKLFDGKSHEDAVEFAKYIHQQLNTKTTGFNYAVCLQMSGHTEESINMLEKLLITSNKSSNRITGLVEKLFQNSHEMKVKIVSNYPKIYLTGEASDADVGSLVLYCHLCLGNYQQALTTARQIVTNVETLIQLLSLTQIPNYHLKIDGFKVDLKLDVKTKRIELEKCSLSLDSFDGLSPEELTFGEVSFFRDGQELEQVNVNDILDFNNIKSLELNCDKKKKNVSVDLNGDFSINHLELNKYVRVLNWTNSNWKVRELKLWYVPFVKKTSMKVQEMIIWHSSLDVSCLPQTIQKLTLWSLNKVFASGGVKLPNLKHLTLQNLCHYYNLDNLLYFRLTPLTHIHLKWIKKVNLDLLPPTLTHLQITQPYFDDTRVVGGVRKLNKLRLDNFSCKGVRVEEYLSQLHTDNLIILNWEGIKVKDLLQLMSKQIKTVAVGKINWKEDDFENYSSQLDRETAFYLLEGGRGRGINYTEFEELSKLF